MCFVGRGNKVVEEYVGRVLDGIRTRGAIRIGDTILAQLD